MEILSQYMPDVRDSVAVREQLLESRSVERIARILAEELYPDRVFPDSESLNEKLGYLTATQLRDVATRALREMNQDWRHVAKCKAIETVLQRHLELTRSGMSSFPSFWNLREYDQVFYRHLMLAGVCTYKAVLCGLHDPIASSYKAAAHAYWTNRPDAVR